MLYAKMRVSDTDALICDFAQYYHIYDIYTLDLNYAATLAYGLPEESRIMRVMSGQKCQKETMIQLAILDTVRAIEHAYIKTHSDPTKEISEYKSILAGILGEEGEEETDNEYFDSADDFRLQWERATVKEENNV